MPQMEVEYAKLGELAGSAHQRGRLLQAQLTTTVVHAWIDWVAVQPLTQQQLVVVASSTAGEARVGRSSHAEENSTVADSAAASAQAKHASETAKSSAGSSTDSESENDSNDFDEQAPSGAQARTKGRQPATRSNNRPLHTAGPAKARGVAAAAAWSTARANDADKAHNERDDADSKHAAVQQLQNTVQKALGSKSAESPHVTQKLLKELEKFAGGVNGVSYYQESVIPILHGFMRTIEKHFERWFQLIALMHTRQAGEDAASRAGLRIYYHLDATHNSTPTLKVDISGGSRGGDLINACSATKVAELVKVPDECGLDKDVCYLAKFGFIAPLCLYHLYCSGEPPHGLSRRFANALRAVYAAMYDDRVNSIESVLSYTITGVEIHERDPQLFAKVLEQSIEQVVGRVKSAPVTNFFSKEHPNCLQVLDSIYQQLDKNAGDVEAIEKWLNDQSKSRAKSKEQVEANLKLGKDMLKHIELMVMYDRAVAVESLCKTIISQNDVDFHIYVNWAGRTLVCTRHKQYHSAMLSGPLEDLQLLGPKQYPSMHQGARQRGWATNRVVLVCMDEPASASRLESILQDGPSAVLLWRAEEGTAPCSNESSSSLQQVDLQAARSTCLIIEISSKNNGRHDFRFVPARDDCRRVCGPN